jgi:hypothetical protein
MTAGILSRLWLWSGAQEFRRFKAALQNPAETQTTTLHSILAENRHSQFGREHDFAHLNADSFSRRVPVRDAGDYEPWLSRAAETDNVLTGQRILYFERTSGTTGQSRLVPYTASFREQINRAVMAWMVSLSRSHPAAFFGPSYWSISPPLRGAAARTASGIRIGATDTEYLSPLSRILVSKILAVPGSVSQIQDADEFYFQTLRALLLTPTLSMISIWSPAFLAVLDTHLRARWKDLQASIPRSRNAKPASEPGTWKEIWPALSVLSCWTDSWAAHWQKSIQRILGDVPVQGKGLLATEGVTSIPFEGKTVLAVRSHYYEFREDQDRVLLPEELQDGRTYEVILTTGGGLYRFATGDIVEVCGFLGRTPCLRFLGRKRTTDLAGEKVTEAQAVLCINAVLRSAGSPDMRAAFLPSLPDKRYTLLIFTPHGSSPGLAASAAQAEEILCQNPYYAQARACGELLAVNARLVTEDEWNALCNQHSLDHGAQSLRIGTQKTRTLLDPVTDARDALPV